MLVCTFAKKIIKITVLKNSGNSQGANGLQGAGDLQGKDDLQRGAAGSEEADGLLRADDLQGAAGQQGAEGAEDAGCCRRWMKHLTLPVACLCLMCGEELTLHKIDI